MAHNFVNPYSGEKEETCSVSFKAQQEMGAHDPSSPQTEAEYNKSKLLGEWGVISAKINGNQIPNGTKVLNFDNKTNGTRGYLFYKDGKLWQQSYTSSGVAAKPYTVANSQGETYINSKYFEVSVPKSADKTLTDSEVKAAKEGQVAAVYKQNLGVSPEYAEASKKYGPGNVKLLSNGQPVVWANLDTLGLDKPGQTFIMHGAIKKYYTPTGTPVTVAATHLTEKVPSSLQLLKADGSQAGQQHSGTAKWWVELVPDDSGKTALSPQPKAKPVKTVFTDIDSVEKGKPLVEEDVFVIQDDDDKVDLSIVAVSDGGAHVKYSAKSKLFVAYAINPKTDKYAFSKSSKDLKAIVGDGSGWFAPAAKSAPPPVKVAAPTPTPAVNSGSDSVGSMSHEDVAAMFVKIKDDLAKEQGLNIKGANPELDKLVFAKIGEATGYTGDEIKAKIDSYKAAGNKLSALKKKVLAGTYKVPDGKAAPTKQSAPSSPLSKPEVKAKAPDPKPNGVPTTATPKVTEEIKKAVALEEKLNELYSDEDAVSAYIIAKDKVVAESNGKWTLYSKSSEMDHAIYSEVFDKTGLGVKEIQDSIANYLATGKKLSALKKQLAKQGAFTPQADSMKKSGATKSQEEKKADVAAKAEAGYTPTPTPATSPPVYAADPGPKPLLSNYNTYDAWKKDLSQWNKDKAAFDNHKPSPGPKVDTGKPAPKVVEKASSESGDISGIPDTVKKLYFDKFKAQGYKSYLSSPSGQNYEALAEIQAEMKLFGHSKNVTLLQLIRVIDEQGAKKAGVDNGKLFENKVATWLTSSEGTAYIKSQEAQLAKKAEQAKLKVEAEKLAKELEDKQPPLPADSVQFQEMTPSKALQFQEQMLAKKPFGTGEKAGLRHYTGGAYTAMNGYLRGLPEFQNLSGPDKNHIEPAIRGFRPAPEPMLLRRGTGANQFVTLGVERGSANLIWGLTGKTFEDKGFLSTSAAGRAAFGGEVALEIEAPAGTPMMWVDNFSKHPGENEMLLRPGLKYKILNVRKSGSTFVVRLRIVDWPGKED